MPPNRDDIPLTGLEAAHLADHSFVALPRFPTRPPSYVEHDMEEPPPTYMDAVRRRIKVVQRYPASKVQSPRRRLCVLTGIALCLIGVIAVPIAIGGSDGIKI